MADGQIKIRISAVSDRSVDTVFGSIEKRAQKARDNINRALGGGASANALAAPLAAAAKQNDLSARQADKAWNQQLKALNNYARDQDRIFKRAAQDRNKVEAAANRARLKDEQETSRAIVRELKSQVRQREQDFKRNEREEVRTRRNFAERTSQRAVKFMFPPPIGIIGAGKRLAGDVLRGAGISLDVGSSVNRVVDLSAQISRLQNQARFNNQDVSHSELETAIKGPADKYGFTRGDTASALGKFADRTGDMQLGMQLLPQLAERAAAHGSGIDDMLAAAGEVALNLGPVKDKAKALVGVLDVMALQGAKGAIEMGDLARTGMARIASSAGLYEGDAGENMKKLGALAQIARQSGGAAKPAEAATAIARMTGQFSTGARVKAFNAERVEVFSKTEKGQYRDPIAIIKDALLKTGGDPMRMNKMFMSSIGAKPVLALSKTFNAAGGGKEGIAAIDKLIGGFMESADIQNRLNAANATRDQEIAVKAQKFQNKLDDITQKLTAKLLPTLESLEKPALRLAGALADLVGWAAANPWKAVAVGVGAAVGRAMLESAMRATIEKRIMGVGNGLLPGRGIAADGSPLPGGGGVWAGRASSAFMAMGAGLTGYAAGSVAGSALFGQRGGEIAGATLGGAAFGGQLMGPWGAAAGAAVGGAVDQAQDLARYTEGWGGIGAGLEGIFTKGSFFDGVDEYQNERAKKRRMIEDDALAHGASPEEATARAQGKAFDQAALSQAVGDGMAARTLKVQVVNAKDFATPAPATGPKVGSAGRAAP